MGVKIVSIFFMLACWKLYRPPNLDIMTKEVTEVEGGETRGIENGGVVSSVFDGGELNSDNVKDSTHSKYGNDDVTQVTKL